MQTTEFSLETHLCRLHVESTGTGPAILCWPSLFCDGRTLRAQVDELSRDHRVVVIDGPGHGRSGVPTRTFTLEHCADLGVQVLDHLGIDRAVWLGTAWGAHVGVVAALRASHRLRGLISMNAPMGAWEGFLRAKFWTLYQTYRFLGPRKFLVDAVVKAQLAEGMRAAHPERAELVADCFRSSEHRGMVRAIRAAMLDRPSLIARLPAVSVPTLFLTGDLDAIFPVEAARAQAKAIPGSRFAVVEGSAHNSPLEKPAEVNVLVREFLQSLQPPKATRARPSDGNISNFS